MEHWHVVAELRDADDGQSAVEVRYPNPVRRDRPKAPAGGIIERTQDGWATVYRRLNPGEETAPSCGGVLPYNGLAPIAVYMVLGDPRKKGETREARPEGGIQH
jgi:hypothetical protein